MGVSLHRARGDVERVGDLLLAEVGVVPEHDHLALPLGQAVDGFEQGRVVSVAQRGRFGAVARGASRSVRGPLDRRQVALLHTLAAEPRSTAVDHGSAKVCQRRPLLAQPREPGDAATKASWTTSSARLRSRSSRAASRTSPTQWAVYRSVSASSAARRATASDGRRAAPGKEAPEPGSAIPGSAMLKAPMTRQRASPLAG